MRLEFHPDAEPGLGERFESEVRRVAELLLGHPEIGQSVDPFVRRLVLPRFPFTLIYSATPDVLRIEVVAHQSRLPGYWRTRIDR